MQNNTQTQNQNKNRSKFIKTSKPEITKAHKEEFDHKADMKQQKVQGSAKGGTAAAVSTALINEVASFAPHIVEDILQKLGERFGEDKIEKFTALLGAKNEDGDASLMNVIRSALPLPQEMTLENLPQLADWEAVRKRIAKNPVMVASAVVAGMGALYVAREYLNTKGDFSIKGLLPEAVGMKKATSSRKKKAAPKRKASVKSKKK